MATKNETQKGTLAKGEKTARRAGTEAGAGRKRGVLRSQNAAQKSGTIASRQRSEGADSGSFRGKSILLIFDESNFPLLEDGKSLYVKFSHDLNLAQFAQAALELGARVYVTTGARLNEENKMWEFASFHPKVSRSVLPTPVSPNVDLVASCGPELLLVKEKFPHARIVAFFAAVHFIESPGLHDRTWLYRISLALRLHVDFVVTQHERMAELVRLLGMLTASVDLADRITTCPLGLWSIPTGDEEARHKRKAKFGAKDKILIGNAGGIWRWTDYKTFLRAYIQAVRIGCDNLRLYITGITQPNNEDHAQHSAEIREILRLNADIVGHEAESTRPIVLIDDWELGGEALKKLLPVLDVGLNLNVSDVEGWQSYRVRLLDYVSNGIPVINTKGDWLLSKRDESCFLEVVSGDTMSYFKTLVALSTGEINIETLRSRQATLAEFLFFRPRYQALVAELFSRPPRTAKDPADLTPCMYDISRLEGRRELKTHISDALENLSHSLLNRI